jgi:hypothetical protein
MILDGNESKRRKLIGETLQAWSRDEILRVFPELAPNDVISVKMGATGEDLILSEKALKLLNNVSFEMKNQKKGNKTLYQFMTQAKKQAKPEQVPVVVLFDHTYPNAEPLLCMSFEAWLMATRRFSEERGDIH